MLTRFRKIIASGMVLTVLAVASVGIFAKPKQALANAPVAVTVDAPRTASEIIASVLKGLGQVLLGSITTALINTVTYATDRLAYDAAVFVASGGNADDPLFENRTVGEYFADYGASVAGEAIGAIDATGVLGNFNLCEPDASLTLAFKFGLQSSLKRPKPRCEWSEVKENWGGFLSDVASTAASPFEKSSLITAKLAESYNPSSSDMSVGILMYTDVLNKAQQDAFLASQRQLFSGFFKDKTDFITGRVETPAEMIQKRINDTGAQTDETRRQVTYATLANGDALKQLGMHVGSVFTSTLLSKFTEKLYSGLFGGLDQTAIDPFNVSATNSTSAADARNTYRSFLTAAPLSIQNFSLLGDFGACPYTGKGLYNCVADSSLISAVSRADGGNAMTIADALEEGLLNRSWPLIPSSDAARDQDPFCYTYGYCHGNLVKLRKARIISTGWELAAESTANSDSSPVTLGTVVDGFYDCNDQNELDANHPWCHLIDPDWVLKYPETQCKSQMYGQLLVSSVSDQRQTECVDMPSCIDQDSNGNCTGGYGYCVREENVWNFRGESCPEHFASCTSYRDPNGTESNFLSNTTDSSVCTADSAGCLWYNLVKEDQGDDVFDWPDYSDASDFATEEASSTLYRDRIYFTAEVSDCASEDAGCKELVDRSNGVTLNMITNPSFEDDVDADGIPDGWIAYGSGTTYSNDGTQGLSGTDSVNPGSGIYYQPGIVLSQGAEYTLSFYAAQNSGTATTGALISLNSSDGSDVDFRGFALSGDCGIFSGDYSVLEIAKTPTDTDYQRFTCTFTAPTLTNRSAELTAFVDMMGGDLWFDDVQLEQESSVSDYHVGYSDSALDLTYVKVPPAYLGCTGDAATDPADCANYAGICNQTEVGCSAYTPANGDPVVDGIVGSLDVCPSSCVGYDTYKQEPTLYEPDGNFPVYFIPDSATECTAQYVGCDEFTNIDTEGVENFTYLRACVTSAQAAANTGLDNAAVFYTWEGSDTSGYQLKTWDLLESDMSATSRTYVTSGGTDAAPNLAPCTGWTSGEEGISCADDADGDGHWDSDTSSCDEHDDTITNPDCREFYDTEGNIHYREWTSTVTVNDACVTYRKTDIVGADAATQATNCEESGGYFDTATAACRYYGYAEESNICPANQAGCREYTGGRSRNSRQAFTEYFEDGDLTNWETQTAADVTLSNESIATDGHSVLSDGQSVWTFVGYQDAAGTACASTDDCAAVAGALGGNCTIANGESSCGTLSDEVFAGKTYTVSFWAKGTGVLSVGFDTSVAVGTIGDIDAPFATGTDAITLDTEWHQYTYGPINMASADYPDFGDGASALVFSPSNTTPTTFYIDNVVLREGEDNITVIKDSWVTPAECDQTQEGASSPQYMLGCQAYTDQNGDVADLKSFSSLCDESKVGCSAYFATQESDSVGASVYGARCSTISGAGASIATSCYYALNSGGTDYDATSQYLCTIGVGQADCEFNLDWYIPAENLPAHLSYQASTVISPADKDIFLVVNDEVECTSGVAGCMEVGLPTFTQDHTAVESWTTVYLMNTPADYSSTLCSQDELFCNAWTSSDNTTHYFKDPQDQTCEYRSDVTINNVTYSGWFKTDTDEQCDPNYIVGGNAAGIWRNGDDDYAGWVGTCSNEYDSCSEFQDISDLATDELYTQADGTSYFYLNNDSLEENSLPDSQKCNGQVSQKDGCGVFNDTSNPAKTASSSATYVASKHADALYSGQQNDLVDTIDCSVDSTIITPTGESVDLCANRCWYDADEYYDINGSPDSDDYVFDGSCYDDTDCRPLTSETGATVTGFCASSYEGVAADRLENDANTVLKVNRDRECSEWLSCSDSQTTWDERTNSYVSICGDIGLCTEYSGAGDASFCSAWKENDPAVVLETDMYSERDVSWYGEDYSGYAIPNLLPIDKLTQVNTAYPYTCVTSSTTNTDITVHEGEACIDDDQCGGSAGQNLYCTGPTGDSDYRLGYVAGSCEGMDYGDDCYVGYCSNTGSACVDDGACGTDGGECVIGTYFTVSTNICASSADCSTGERCLGGFCATTVGDANIGDDTTVLPSGQSFYPSVNYQTGTCMYDQCVIAPNGSTFNENNSEAKVCRGYPEQNSPFSNDVVVQWQDPTTNGDVTGAEPSEVWDSSADTATSNTDALPVSYVQNFENVKNCVYGEDCQCSYQKVSYGNSGATKYFAQDTSLDPGSSRICTGGKIGSACTTNEECNNVDATDGVCSQASKVDQVLGLEGYCLERDSATNILGNRDLNACLTWLPVDQLAGSTDLYAKYSTAGYVAETNYCTYVTPYVDLLPSKSGADIACGEKNTDGSLTEFASCIYGTSCPAGYFLVVGSSDNDSDANDDNTYAENYCRTGGSDTDCPFVCVPIGSRNTTDNSNCDPDFDADRGAAFDYDDHDTSDERYSPAEACNDASLTCEVSGEACATDSDCGRSSAVTYTMDNYYISDPGEFDGLADALQNCEAVGVQYRERSIYVSGGTNEMDYTTTSSLFSQEETVNYGAGFFDDTGWYNFSMPDMPAYLACKESVAVDDGSGLYAAPYTDRLLNENFSYTLPVSGGTTGAYSNYAYAGNTATAPFGVSLTPASVNAIEGVRPAKISQCYDDDTESDTYGFSAPTLIPGGTDTCTTSPIVDLASPESRAYIAFDGSTKGDMETVAIDSVEAGGAATYSSEARLLQSIFANSLNYAIFEDGVIDNDTGEVQENESTTTEGTMSYLYGSSDEAAEDAYSDMDSSLVWDNRVTGTAPSVWAVDMDNCYNDKCEEDQNHSLTLNDQNEGDVTSDVFYRAYLKFYAAADKDQLPLRRIIVDWGDDSDLSGSTADDNFYKNHRGLEDGTETSICDTDPADSSYEWGMNDLSCDPNYFTYNHIYTCNPAGLLDCSYDTEGNVTNSPCTPDDGNSCTYRPRVHARDNWGWCTGTCTSEGAAHDSDNGGDGCYSNGYGLDPGYITNSYSECAYGYYTTPGTATDPWAYYDGNITVTP